VIRALVNMVLTLAAALALALFCIGNAQADPGDLTATQRAFLARLSTAGIPYQDPVATVLVGLDFCSTALGGRVNDDQYQADVTRAGAVNWTSQQNRFFTSMAVAYLCPAAAP
jgi:hypothetical protein